MKNKLVEENNYFEQQQPDQQKNETSPQVEGKNNFTECRFNMKDLSSTDTIRSSVTTRGQHIEQSKEEQKNFAAPLLNKKLVKGDKWYLISSDWYTRWMAYLGMSVTDLKPTLTATLSPDKINNKTLIDSISKQLRTDLSEEMDYFTIPEELWDYLKKIYSITQEEDIIERFVIDDNVDGDSSLVIEIYPLSVGISCSESAKKDSTQKIILSRQTTLKEVAEKIRNAFQIPATVKKPARFLFRSNDENSLGHPCEISNKVTLNNSGYGIQDIIHLEFQNEKTNTWPSEAPKVSSTLNTVRGKHITAVPVAPPIQNPVTVTHSLNTRHAASSFSNRHNDHKPGLCGLSNLGNTCFMNSSIQMMSNVPSLTDYFRSGRYKQEINTRNPLGCGGQLAEAYADLVNELWSGNNSYTMPRTFKLQIGKFAPQFTGFAQQDSHELLAFLLDGLHEDLNRIMDKPYVQMGSHVGKTDKQFAEESWQDHLKRNDSIIVDLFGGLLKSTLNCLTCGEISIKFDPYYYLSLPLPTKKERAIEIFFVALDLNVPITKLKLSVNKNGTVSDLCNALVALVPSVNKQRLVVCDVYTCKFFKIYDQNEQVSMIRDRDEIYIYELSSNYTSTDHLRVKVHLKEKTSYHYSSTYFGLPIYLTVPKADLTFGSLYQYILDLLKRYIDIDQLSKNATTKTNSTNDSTVNTSSEEINSKLSDSLNVKDEESEAARNDIEVDMAKEDGNQPNDEIVEKDKKLFQMVFSKTDNIDYDNHQLNEYTDDTPFDWKNMLVSSVKETYGSQSLHAAATANQVISVVADFGQKLNKRIYNKKAIEDFAEHPSLTHIVKKKDLSLMDCFTLYTKTEKLSENDFWYCSKCKSFEPSTKKFDIWSLPKVLVLQLKRFSYSRNFRDKIDSLVDYPIRDLDLAEYLIQGNSQDVCTKYNLIAVSNHYGSLGGGHYTAYGMNRNDERWYYFDDSSVSSADPSNVCTHNAYLLTYIRQDCYNTTYQADIENENNEAQFENTSQEKMDY